jgi:mono/diheme cytochrome c family protein
VRRALILLFVAVASLAASASSGPPANDREPDRAAFDAVVKPFLEKNCTDCHNNRRQKGGMNFERLESADLVATHLDDVEHMLLKIRTGEMPPEDEERPDPKDVEAVSAWIEQEFARLERVTPPDPGRITARRLNRTEYSNSVRDLFGIDVRPADDFPQDDAGYGFDNIADVLSLSPVLLEKYMGAAEKVVRTAMFGYEPQAPTLVRLKAPTAVVAPVRAVPATYDTTGLSLPNSAHATHRVAVPGKYLVRLFLNGRRPLGSMPVRIGLHVDGVLVAEQTLDPAAQASFDEDEQELDGKTLEFTVPLAVGERWIAATILHLYDGLPARFNGPNPSARPEQHRVPEFTPPRNATPERLEQARKNFDQRMAALKTAAINSARVGRLELAGPFEPETRPAAASLKAIYACGHVHTDVVRGRGGSPSRPSTSSSAPKLTARSENGPYPHEAWCGLKNISAVAQRAFRRPVAREELAPYVAVMARAQKAGESFDEALAIALQALLVSPDFLFRIEQDRPAVAGAQAVPVSDHELASRLSYFLWSSLPDAELRRLADRRMLRTPATLEAQVRRMLADPKARALVEEFGGQWLQFRALESVVPDRDKFPTFDNYLRLSMRNETMLFFEHIVREDRSVLEFLDAKYTYLNERLAQHYGVEGVAGPTFRRVELTGGQRGGVLTQASVLTVSSYATRTSPVLRGKWVLDNLLDAPPPDPPAGVPALDETAVGQTASLRQQMEAHRANPTCASCHRRMDPLGFGLENYDAIGAWRAMDGKFAIDPKGELPDGRTFHQPSELRTILLQDRQDFARALTSKLMIYALGRGLERHDKPTVRGIVQRLPQHDYRFSGLVLEIVTSLPFQMRRAAPAGVTAP